MSGDPACPGSDTLTRFLTEGMPAGEREGVARHLDACSGCALVVEVPQSSARTARRGEAGASSPSERGTLTSGSVLAGRYRIAALLGTGGMGEVYEAFDLSLNETVAVKTVRATIAGDPRAVELLKSEVQLARRVTHRNVCRIFDFGMDRTDAASNEITPFFTMELLRGTTLARRLIARGPMPAADTLRIARQIAAGLLAAHGVGVIHKDLKSDNVILSGPDDPELRATVTDFGLAATRGLVDEPAGEVVSRFSGTPGYIAPERLVGRPATEASDVFALGVVLEDLAMGTLPARRAPSTAPAAGLEPLLALARRCQALDPAARPALPEVCAAVGRLEGRLRRPRAGLLRRGAGAGAVVATVLIVAAALGRSRLPAETQPGLPVARPSAPPPLAAPSSVPATPATPSLASTARWSQPTLARRPSQRPRRALALPAQMPPQAPPAVPPTSAPMSRDEPIRDLFPHAP